jgi:cyanophycin synthetase
VDDNGARAVLEDRPESPARGPQGQAKTGTASGEWSLLAAPWLQEGFAYGFRSPSVLFTVRPSEMSAAKFAIAANRILAPMETCSPLVEAGAPLPPAAASGSSDIVEQFLALLDRINALANLPLDATAKPIARDAGASICVVPTLLLGLPVMGELIPLLIAAINSKGPLDKKTVQRFTALFDRLAKANYPSGNGPRLARAANQLGIATTQLPGFVSQFGIGRNSIMMDSSSADGTSVVAVRLARNKSNTSQLLKRFRLPVAQHIVASSADEAVAAAERIGWPVVVKPLNLDGGVGVRADLRTESELRAAFETAKEYAKVVMVEKHYAGVDHRFQVVGDKIIWQIAKLPGGVTGNGRDTIERLVEIANRDPRRGTGKRSTMKLLVLDDEAKQLLARDGMSTTTVPSAGSFVQLRRTSNVNNGGEIVDVDAHPENLKLAVRAAKALRLDIAGVDIICPDITRPWQEVGAIISEVNGRPDLGGFEPRVWADLLRELVPNGGRIPVIAFLGASEAERLAQETAGILSKNGFTVGLHTRQGSRIGDEWLDRGNLASLQGSQGLVSDKTVDAIVLGSIEASAVRTGLAMPEIDLAVFTGEPLLNANGQPMENTGMVVLLLRMIEPHCKNLVSLASGDALTAQLRAALQQAKTRLRLIARETLFNQISALRRR